MDKFVVQYYDKNNQLLVESKPFDTYEEAEQYQKAGKPTGFEDYVAYAKIEKRFYYT